MRSSILALVSLALVSLATSRAVAQPCVSDHAECDGDPATRCETDLSIDRTSCGGCGHTCTATDGCEGGACVHLEEQTRRPRRYLHSAPGSHAGFALHVDGPAYTVRVQSVVSPLRLGGLSGATRIAAGALRTCVIGDGRVRCLGRNVEGALGRPNGAQQAQPRVLPVPEVRGATDLSLGGTQGCAVVGGEVWCWGRWWAQPETHRAPGDGRPRPIEGLHDVARVAVGQSYACGLRRDGTVACWGRNQHGVIGDGTRTDRERPVTVDGLRGVQALAAGERHVCAVRAGGEVWCWGFDNAGQAGGPPVPGIALRPQRVSGLPPAREVVVGELHSCALGTDGSVRCWGSNVHGQVGFASGSHDSGRVWEAHRVELPPARSLASGPRHTCALLVDGTARCWGANERGQCGGGHVGPLDGPVEVRWLDHVVELAAGDDHTCARLTSGEVRCWGATDYGVLGR